jgi:hypothetical protein
MIHRLYFTALSQHSPHARSRSKLQPSAALHRSEVKLTEVTRAAYVVCEEAEGPLTPANFGVGSKVAYALVVVLLVVIAA